MFKIFDISEKKNYFFSNIACTVTLFVFGVFLIISSISNISSIQESFSNNKFFLPINIHKDFFIKKVSSKNKKNDQLSNESSDINDLSVNLDKDYQILDSSFELSSIKYKNLKKQKFINSLLPLIVQENLKIRLNRKKLLEIKNFLIIHKTLNKADQEFIEALASKYRVNTANKHKIDILDALLETVDEIPNSIALAQAANESGWGTSRFAKDYNALFGEYTFNTYKGIVPIDRKKGENHLIKFFSAIDKSVESYFINLNTHLAYKDFRMKRQKLRRSNLNLDPWSLVQHLEPYAQDENYVNTIKLIIKSNNLIKFDNIAVIITKS